MRRLALRGIVAKARSLSPLLVVLSLSATAFAQTTQAGGGVALSTSNGAEATGSANATPAAAPAAAPPKAEQAPIDADRKRGRELRAGTSYLGPVGGVYIIDAGSGAAGSFRINVASDFFVKKNYLRKADKNRYVGGVLSLSATPIEHLELSAAVTTRSNRNSAFSPTVVQSMGDLHFDVKAYHEVIPGLTLGADAMVSLLNEEGDVGFVVDATGLTIRGNVAVDLREFGPTEVPLQVRLNAGYSFDNSANTVADLEEARYNNLRKNGQTQATSPDYDYNHYINRAERLGLGVNRVDRVTLGLGFEAPIEVNDDFAIHPLAEYQVDLPVNRQGFKCPYVLNSATGQKLANTDSCLKDEGASTIPQHVMFGMRMWPVAGLSLLAAVDIGLSGTTTFVQELAPQAPYRIIFGAGYTVDARKKAPEVREVEKIVEVEVNKTPITGRIIGSIVEAEANTPVPDAKVSFPGKDTTTLFAGAEGRFVSYAFEPGEVAVDMEAPGYQPGTCTTAIPEKGGDVQLICALIALPRMGSLKGQVLDGEGAPVANVKIILSGPEVRTLTTDPTGKFADKDLKPGEYNARIEQDGFLISVTPVVIKPREEADVSIKLMPVPKVAAVKVKKDKIQIKDTIFFTIDTADIEARSEPLLTEIADAIMRNPEVLKVEVQGHTDDTGTTEYNVDLAQRRAEAVKSWLTKAGVERDRLIAKGFGREKPLAPNLTPANRAKNRRVEFMILERAGD